VSPAGDRWLRIVARPNGPGGSGELAAALLGAGGKAVEEREDGALLTCVRLEGDPAAAEARLRRALEGIAGGDGPAFEVVEDPGWLAAWTRGLEPRRVGRRLIVVPAGPGDLVLRLEPGMAFGTGDHGTTRGALELLEPVAAGARDVLDIGTGTGVLAIAALLLGAERALGIDPSPEALESAGAHARAHGVAGRLRLARLEADAAVLRLLASGKFDLVLANVDRATLEPLLGPLREIVSEEGRVVVAGITDGEAPAFREAASAARLEAEAETVDGGWWSARLRPA